MRKTRHLVALCTGTVVAVCQRDAEYAGGNDGIVAVGLVEVAATEQQQCLRVFLLEVEKLFHHRGKLLRAVFLCHLRVLIEHAKVRKMGETRKSSTQIIVIFCEWPLHCPTACGEITSA